MRRLLALATTAVLFVPVPAGAHDPAQLRVAAPADGATVEGDTVRVVVVGEGGTAAATFRIDVDGRPVDATGKVDGVFTTLTVEAGKQVEVEVPVAQGGHELRVTPEQNPDGPTQPAVVVRFDTVPATGFAGKPALLLLGVLAVVGVAGLLRMRTAKPGDFENPGHFPA